MDPIVVAYTCNARKRAQFDAIAKDAAAIPGLEFVEASKTARYDALLHKRTDDFVGALTADAESVARLRDFRKMLTPSVVPVDDLAGIPKLIDRAEMSFAVENAIDASSKAAKKVLRSLRWAVVRADAPRASLESTFGSFDFPVIIKRRLACGTPESHEMAIAHDLGAAVETARTMLRDARCNDSFSRSLFVQEFVRNHGALLFKVYVIGDRVSVQTRVSVDEHATPASGKVVTFDSQVMSKSARSAGAKAAKMPEEIARQVADMMRSELDVSLFGVDLIFDMRTQRYCIVDVNYFPGYKNVANANRLILLHAMEKVRERRRMRATQVQRRPPLVDWTRVAAAAACADWAGAHAASHAVVPHDAY